MDSSINALYLLMLFEDFRIMGSQTKQIPPTHFSVARWTGSLEYLDYYLTTCIALELSKFTSRHSSQKQQ